MVDGLPKSQRISSSGGRRRHTIPRLLFQGPKFFVRRRNIERNIIERNTDTAYETSKTKMSKLASYSGVSIRPV